MKICIGIISYLPDDKYLRDNRFNKLCNLLLRLDKLFKLPIIIICQNWGEQILPVTLENSEVLIYSYKNKLGITGARKKLRDKFLESDYDYLIMLDDDIKLLGSEESAIKYLDQIYSHPGMFGTFKSLTLQLFAISKEIFSLINYPDGDPVNGDYFEDMWLIMALKKLYPNKYFSFTRGDLDPVGNAANDEYSTWYHRQFVKRQIGDRTRSMVREL